MGNDVNEKTLLTAYLPAPLVKITWLSLISRAYEATIENLLVDKSYGKFPALQAQHQRQLHDEIRNVPEISDDDVKQKVLERNLLVLGKDASWRAWNETQFARKEEIYAGLEKLSVDDLGFASIQIYDAIQRYQSDLNTALKQELTENDEFSITEKKHQIAEEKNCILQIEIDKILYGEDSVSQYNQNPEAPSCEHTPELAKTFNVSTTCSRSELISRIVAIDSTMFFKDKDEGEVSSIAKAFGLALKYRGEHKDDVEENYSKDALIAQISTIRTQDYLIDKSFAEIEAIAQSLEIDINLTQDEIANKINAKKSAARLYFEKKQTSESEEESFTTKYQRLKRALDEIDEKEPSQPQNLINDPDVSSFINNADLDSFKKSIQLNSNTEDDEKDSDSEQRVSGTQYLNALDVNNQIIFLKKHQNHILFCLLCAKLNSIAIESQNAIEQLLYADDLMKKGRHQAEGFSASAASTMVGGSVLTVMEATEDSSKHIAALALSVSLATGVPIFGIVTIMNWYITKNIVGELIHEMLNKEDWEIAFSKKTFQNYTSFMLSVLSTAASALFTGYATYVFVKELILELSKDAAIEVANFFGGIFFALTFLYTIITYLAAMHYYGKKISFSGIIDDFKEVGDLAMIARMPWLKIFLFKFILLAIPTTLIFTLVSLSNPVGWALLSLLVAYSLFTGGNYLFNANAPRLQAQLQLMLFVLISIVAAFFIMFAAIPLMIPIIGLTASVILISLAWLGIVAFYKISSIASFKRWLREDIPFVSATTAAPLQHLRKTKPETETIPLINKLFTAFRGINAGANATPATLSALEMDKIIDLTSLETLTLAATVTIGGSFGSYALNYGGMPKDKTYTGAIDMEKHKIYLINTLLAYYQGIMSVESFIDQYMQFRDKKDEYTTFFHTDYSKTDEREVCRKLKALIQTLKEKGTLTEQDLETITPMDTEILQQGQMKLIWEKITPILQIASNTTYKLQNELGILRAAIKDYIKKRNTIGNYSFTFCSKRFSLQNKYLESYSRDEKIPVAEKLLAKLALIDDFLTKLTGKSVKPCDLPDPATLFNFTEKEKTILLDGDLGKLYAKAEPYLRTRYFLPTKTPSKTENLSLPCYS